VRPLGSADRCVLFAKGHASGVERTASLLIGINLDKLIKLLQYANNSLVNIMTDYKLHDWVLISGRSKKFSLPYHIQTHTRCHTISYVVGTGDKDSGA
jgi:hypothetical protein